MDDTPSIPPALTKEEWAPRVDPDIYAGQVIEAGDVARRDDGTIILGNDLPITRPHATAALCLYGQPFGFTHEELGAMRDEYKALWAGNDDHPRARLLHSTIEKIAALLPPEAPR